MILKSGSSEYNKGWRLLTYHRRFRMKLLLSFLLSLVLTSPISAQGESTYYALLAEDFNRDGVCDVIRTGYDGKALYFKGVGDGTLEPPKELHGPWWGAFMMDAPVVTPPYIYTITPAARISGRYNLNVIYFDGIIQALIAQHQIDPEGDLAFGYITSVKMCKLDNSRDGDTIPDIIAVWNTEIVIPEHWPPKWNRHAAYLSPTELSPVQNFFTDVAQCRWVTMVGFNAVEASKWPWKRNNDFILTTTGMSNSGNGIGFTCFEEGEIGPKISYHKWNRVPIPLKTHLGTLPYDVMVKGQFRLNPGQPKPTVSIESTIMGFVSPNNKDEIFFFFPWFVPNYFYRTDEEVGFPLFTRDYWFFNQESVADLDNDGWDEFIAMVGIFVSHGADGVIVTAPRVPTVQQTILFPPYIMVSNTAVGDFNRDGKKDIVIGALDYNRNGATIMIYSNLNPNPFPFVQTYKLDF